MTTTLRRWLQLAGLAVASSLGAQTPVTNSASEIVSLNPFEVQSDSDRSYGALNSSSITRFNTELDKMPVSADILTDTFMKDVSATTVEDLIQSYSAGAGYSGVDPGGTAATQQPGDRNGGAYLTLRGFFTPTTMRDGLMPLASTGGGITTNFDIERVEIIQGPQSLLYGEGGAGGVINVVSKPAVLGGKTRGEISYRVDQYGGKQALLDYGAGTDTLAMRFSYIDQDVALRRQNIGGPMQGYYAQFAARLFHNTTIRLTGEETSYNQIIPNNITYSGSTTDSRNGADLNYLLATDQAGAVNPATGAAYPDGAIDNGLLNWGNVNSYEGQWFSYNTVNQFESLTADTVWTPWLSTQLGGGYNVYTHDLRNATLSLLAPKHSPNTVGDWAAQITPTDYEQPDQTKALRFSALATHDFGRVAHTQTVLGVDNITQKTDQVQYEYFLADSNFNPIYGVANSTNGRTPLTAQTYSIANGPVLYNLWTPTAKRILVGGVPYVRMMINPVDPTKMSPTNPLGLNATGGYTITRVMNQGLYGVNYTTWLDGKLETLAGFRTLHSAADTYNQVSNYINVTNRQFSYNLGAVYNLLPWLHPYAEVSDSYNPPSQSYDPLGNLPQAARGLSEETGVKFGGLEGSISGQLAVYHTKSTNEQMTVTATLVNDINPTGFNGRFGAPSTFINVDRQTQGAQLTLTAAPTSNLRTRLSMAWSEGRMGRTVQYGQLYNDQFHLNGQGQVTYADGSVVYVNPTFNSKVSPISTSTTAGAVPLTLTAINTPGNTYYANPQTVTGAVAPTSALAAVLNTVDPAHGSIATGVSGVPISQIQYNAASNASVVGYVPPPGTITAAQAGDRTTGYPEFAVVATALYTLPQGWLKGVGIGGTVRGSWNYQFYYYYTNGITPAGGGRTLLYKPNSVQFDPILSYTRKFGRVAWRTQLNISNVFNNYDVILLPGPNTGYTPTGTNATFTNQPRAYVWTNSIDF